MADSIRATFDQSGWDNVLDRLNGAARESLARRMAVAGGEHLRDEAKLRVPHWEGDYNPLSRGSQAQGTLRDAIYLAFDKRKSTDQEFRYVISWNSKTAFWGVMVEFGYTRKYKIYQGKDGLWYTAKDAAGKPIPSDEPFEKRRVAARPFLASAYDAELERARTLMLESGRRELPLLLGGGT